MSAPDGSNGGRPLADRAPTIRLLHASDVHVDDGPGGTRGLIGVVDAAEAHEVDLVVLVGDTFDRNRVRPETVSRVRDALARLSVPVVVLPGNHDPVMDGNVYDRVELPAHVHVLRADEGETVELSDLGVEIWGRAHTSFGDSRPLAELPARGAQPWQIALAHGHLVRRAEDRLRSYLITLDEIADCDRDYVALGHWDVQCDVSAGGVTAWYSGSPTRFSTCALVTLHDGDAGRAVDVEPVTLAD